MTKKQFWIIAAIILLPCIIGILLTPGNSSTDSFSDWNPPGQKKIGLVRVTDVIYSSEQYVRQLRELRTDNSIAGIILRINSPGGTVGPSQEIYAEVMRFRQSGKPVIVSMENVAASGGYYIAAAASKIFADPGTLTGSFGVYMRFPHYYKLTEKLGVDFTTIKAGKYKDVGNPNRAMTEEEQNLLQGLIDDTHQQFIEDIARGRSMPVDSVRQYADGRIFTGRQAAKLGFVDSLGGYEDALRFLKTSLKLSEKTHVVEKNTGDGIWQKLLEEAKSSIPAFRNLTAPGGMYFLYE